MENCGIYLITCTRPGKRSVYYVGQSNDLKRRLGQHRSNLRHDRHHNCLLASYWKKYGSNSFTFEVLETCDLSHLDEIEGWWLGMMVGHSSCCNFGTTPGAANRGVKFSAETRERMSKAAIGKKKTKMGPEARKNMSLAQTGKKRTAEMNAANSLRQLGDKNHMFGVIGIDHPKSIQVVGTCLKTSQIITLESMSSGSARGFLKAKISECCKGTRRSHGGYSWKIAFTPSPA
jgi:group I intron endonuclease